MNKQLLLAAVLMAPIYGYADDCRYSKEYDFSVDSASLEKLRLDVGAGSLSVEGSAASNEVRVVATACANSRNRLDELDLTHRIRDSDLLIRTERYRSSSIFSWLSFSNTYSYINIEVTMPNDLALEVDDGSGGIEISNVSSLSLDDGSGSILIEDISGNVDVDDGSGSIRISGVNGKVSVSDGSGPISIRDSNEVVIVDDGSGGIRIRDVAGNVEIGDAGSGSVDVSGVAGNTSNHND
jgi:hypothetical protein